MLGFGKSQGQGSGDRVIGHWIIGNGEWKDRGIGLSWDGRIGLLAIGGSGHRASGNRGSRMGKLGYWWIGTSEVWAIGGLRHRGSEFGVLGDCAIGYRGSGWRDCDDNGVIVTAMDSLHGDRLISYTAIV